MAKDWMSQAELVKDTSIYAKFVLVIAGVAAWDVLSTLPFDWSIISGKRKFRWPMLLYFAARIAMLLHIFAYAVNLNAMNEIPCQQVVWISKVTDGFGTPCATFILVLRTVAVWHQNKWVFGGLGSLWLGQIVLWIQTFRWSKSVWSPQRHVCQVIGTAPNALIVTVFSYTMALDFIILCLCSFRLYKSRTQSGIQNLLFRDGIIYFIAAFGANLLESVLAGLRLNPVMNIFALPFALVVSVIAATSVFRNVFTLYDDFANASRPTASGASYGASGANTRGPLAASRARGFSVSKNQPGTDTFALGSVGGHQHSLGGIEVTRTIDVERGGDAVHLPYGQGVKFGTSTRPGDIDEEGSDGWEDRDEKKSHLPL